MELSSILRGPLNRPALVPIAALLALTFLFPSSCRTAPRTNDVPLYEDLLSAEREKHKPRVTTRIPTNRPTRALPALDDEDPESPSPETHAEPEIVTGWTSYLAGCESEAVGTSSHGKLRQGRLLPAEGTGYLRKNEKAPYGTDETVAILTWAFERMTQLYPGTAAVVVGDISAERGGKLRPHSSHQNGLDVDIGYYYQGNERQRRFLDATADNLDTEKTWSLLEILLSTERVEYLFIDRRIQPLLFDEASRRGWSTQELQELFEAPLGARQRIGIIRHFPGHKNHIHVRFVCDASDGECR